MANEEADDQPVMTTRGDGEVAAAIVGGVHGDEPSGVRAVEALLADEAAGRLPLAAAVRFVTANPAAVAANRRYLEVDLNRSFPGDPGGCLEERLAATLCELVAEVPTLALHATRSSGTPFAFAPWDDDEAIAIASQLSVPHLVLSDGEAVGSLSVCGTVVTLESGRQGSDEAATAARELAEEFLIATGAIEADLEPGDPAVFEIGEAIERPPGHEFEVLVENFERVEAGQPFARVDGTDIVADEAFYPVLLSADGYDEILGFRGDKVADSVHELAEPHGT